MAVGYTNVRDGRWHLIAITGDSFITSVYVDGVREAAGGFSPPPVPRESWLQISGEFAGLIDEIKIYDYPRNASEILDAGLTFCLAP